eukprot:TRINITY_DN6054_c0_g1_i1.p1 TRINITY_DN6054_c0_g1~~TRINITY_DN6054_c0_g1_i1.p1  ORF type:complete len:193 (+),score=34.55 TRINITY_DN6054_c0_g1_i1:208-786(+)
MAQTPDLTNVEISNPFLSNQTVEDNSQFLSDQFEFRQSAKKLIKLSKNQAEKGTLYHDEFAEFAEELLKIRMREFSNKTPQLSSSLATFGHFMKIIATHKKHNVELETTNFHAPLKAFVDFDFRDALDSAKKVEKAKADYESAKMKLEHFQKLRRETLTESFASGGSGGGGGNNDWWKMTLGKKHNKIEEVC